MTILVTKQKLATTGWATIVPAPLAGKIKRVDLRATNVTAGGVFASGSVQIEHTGNTGPRTKAYPLPPTPDPDCTVMFEYGVVLTEGQALQISAGANDSVAFSAEVEEGGVIPGLDVLPTKQLLGTMDWVTICVAPAPNRVRRVDLRATNVTAGGVYASASVRIVDAGDGTNSGPRANAHPLPPQPDRESTVILEHGLKLTAGQALQVTAGALNSVAFSAEVQDMAAADA